jgi:threonine synthase
MGRGGLCSELVPCISLSFKNKNLMKYRSTRDHAKYPLLKTFEEVVLEGLAEDGGLFIPNEIPSLPLDFLERFSSLSFQQLCLEIFPLFIPVQEIPHEDLKILVEKSFAKFRDVEITPVSALLPDQNLFLLELFHGPTFAFVG